MIPKMKIPKIIFLRYNIRKIILRCVFMYCIAIFILKLLFLNFTYYIIKFIFKLLFFEFYIYTSVFFENKDVEACFLREEKLGTKNVFLSNYASILSETSLFCIHGVASLMKTSAYFWDSI